MVRLRLSEIDTGPFCSGGESHIDRIGEGVVGVGDKTMCFPLKLLGSIYNKYLEIVGCPGIEAFGQSLDFFYPRAR